MKKEYITDYLIIILILIFSIVLLIFHKMESELGGDVIRNITSLNGKYLARFHND